MTQSHAPLGHLFSRSKSPKSWNFYQQSTSWNSRNADICVSYAVLHRTIVDMLNSKHRLGLWFWNPWQAIPGCLQGWDAHMNMMQSGLGQGAFLPFLRITKPKLGFLLSYQGVPFHLWGWRRKCKIWCKMKHKSKPGSLADGNLGIKHGLIYGALTLHFARVYKTVERQYEDKLIGS